MLSLLSALLILFVLAGVRFYEGKMRALLGLHNLRPEPRRYHDCMVFVGAVVPCFVLYTHGILAGAVAAIITVIAVVDYVTELIPDSLQFFGASLAAWLCIHEQSFWQWHILLALLTVAALIMIAKVYQTVSSSEPMGFGDVKMIGWLVLLGGEAIILAILTAAVFYLPFVLVQARKGDEKRFPFAPVLALGSFVYFWGIG